MTRKKEMNNKNMAYANKLNCRKSDRKGVYMFKMNRSSRAFSLVEILFAVIIIGVLTAVAIPSLFSQKGKADDSNAKQTLRTVQQLIRTAQDDSGSFIVDNTGSLSGYLKTIEKDINFVSGTNDACVSDNTTSCTNSGNVRWVSVSDPAGDIVYIVAKGAKSGTTFTCWGIKIDGSGATATTYYRWPGQTQCTAATISGATGSKTGDFPLK